MNNMDTNCLQTEEPALVHDDSQDENNVSNTQTNGSNGTAITFEPLRPEKVRWFYKSDHKRWTKFDGFDSLNIEYRYRANFGNEEDVSSLNGSFNYFVGLYTVVVRGGLYEVDLSKKKCTSIFWPGKGIFYNVDFFILILLIFKKVKRVTSFVVFGFMMDMNLTNMVRKLKGNILIYLETILENLKIPKTMESQVLIIFCNLTIIYIS